MFSSKHSRTSLTACAVIAVAALTTAPASGTSYDWIGSGGVKNGCNGRIEAIVRAPDGSTYVGGQFSQCGAVAAQNIARWDGSAWHPLGNGLVGTVSAIAVFEGQLIIGGVFSAAIQQPSGCVVRWDGSQFIPMGTLDAQCSTGAVLSATSGLYIGSGPYRRGGSVLGMVLRWNGSDFDPVGTGLTSQGGTAVFALEELRGSIYAAGFFALPVGNGVSRWDGATWQSVGYVGSVAGSMRAYEGKLHVGNSFFGFENGNAMQRLDAGGWTPLPLFGQAFDMTVHAGELVLAGRFPLTESISARWNGATGNGLDQTPVATALTVASSGADLWLGGAVDSPAGSSLGSPSRRVAGTWVATGQSNDLGADGPVNAIATAGARTYFAGEFRSIGGISAKGVAYRESGSWHTLGTGIAGAVHAIAIDGANVYVTGQFSSAGGQAAANVARYHPTSGWTALGAGLYLATGSSGGRALAWFENQLYVGGGFAAAGGQAAQGLARWNGSAWQTFPEIVSGAISALEIRNGQLLAAGFVTMTGTGRTVLRLNGDQWQSIATAGDAGVSALTVYQGDLLAAGAFTQINGVSAVGLARWNGLEWTSVPDFSWAMNGVALTAASARGKLLCVGGLVRFFGIDRKIICFDGESWRYTLAGGSAPSTSIRALHAVDDAIWVGGDLSQFATEITSGYALLQTTLHANGFE